MARNARLPRLRATPLVTLMSLPLLLGPMFFVRWMGFWDRFLLPGFVLGLVVVTLLVARLARGRRRLGAALIVIICTSAIPTLRNLVETIYREPIQPGLFTDEPYRSALRQIPVGSRILLVGWGDTREYALFAPRDGFANRVTLWGPRPFDARRMRSLIDAQGITHVLLDRDDVVDIHWAPPLRTDVMMQWTEGQPDMKEVPVPTPKMRLFVRKFSATPSVPPRP